MGPRSTVFRDARVCSKQAVITEITCKSMGFANSSTVGRRVAMARSETGGFGSTAKMLQGNRGTIAPCAVPSPNVKVAARAGFEKPAWAAPFYTWDSPQARQFTMKRTSRSLRSSHARCELTSKFTGSSQYNCEVLPNFTLPGSPQLQTPPGCPT